MSTCAPLTPDQIAESLHASAIHLLRRLRRLDGDLQMESPQSSASGMPSWTANAPRLSALSVIVFSGSISLGRLAEAEQVRPPTMTRIVHALVAAGLVVKAADPGDRRTIRLSATTRGRRLLLHGRNRRVEALAARIATLSASDQTTLLRALPIFARLASSQIDLGAPSAPLRDNRRNLHRPASRAASERAHAQKEE